MFPRNATYDGFAFSLRAKADGTAITSGTVTGYVVRDGGSQDNLTGAKTHEGNGEWTTTLESHETNGAVLGYLFTHTSAIPVHFTIFTNGQPERGVSIVLPFALIDKQTGAALTSDTVSGYVTADGGTQTALTNSPTHVGNGQWKVTLTAAEMDAGELGLTFVHADGLTEHLTFVTTTPLIPSTFVPDTSSPLKRSAQQLRQMIALSAAYQEQGGTLDTVYLTETAFETPRPWAIVAPAHGLSWNLIAGGSQNWLRPRGSLFVMLTLDTPDDFATDRLAAEYHAADYFGRVMQEVVALAGADSPDGEPLLAITQVTEQYCQETDERSWPEIGRYFMAGYTVEWGDG